MIRMGTESVVLRLSVKGGRVVSKRTGAEAGEANCDEIATGEKSVLSGQLVMASSWLIAGDAQCGLSCARSLEKIHILQG